MAATDVEIANLALDNLGVTQKLDALTDTTKEGQAANRWYTQSRDMTLLELPWRFAKRYSTALTEITNESNTEWDRIYTLPADLLAMRRIVSGNRIEGYDDKIPYDLMLNAAGTTVVLVTDFYDTDNGTKVEYTARISDPTKFPAHFVEALAWKLAASLIMPLALKPDLTVIAQKAYVGAINHAWQLERPMFSPDPPPESEFIRVR